jgi:hypothetical protein
LKQFVNHWASEFLLKEAFNNHFNYSVKQLKLLPASMPTNDESSDDDAQQDNARKARRAALERSLACKASKRKADNVEEEVDNQPTNDGETEPEDIPDALRKRIEWEEIGIPHKCGVMTCLWY